MNILCELNNKYKSNCIRILKEGNKLLSILYEDSIDNILFNVKSEKDKTIVLLDEEKFNIYNFDIFVEFEDKITVDNIRNIVDEKLLSIYKNYGQNNYLLFYTIDGIIINGEMKNYIIGETGSIFFKLSFFFLKSKILQFYQLKSYNIFNYIDIYPSSLFTTLFIKTRLNKNSFFLLYIEENNTKLLHIQNGFYSTVENINIGSNMLKEIYSDNNIFHLFFIKKDNLDISPLVKDIIYQSVDFFTQTIAKWLKQYISQNNDLILISSLNGNIFFQEQFNKRYNYFINGFILPFTSSNILDNYGKKWKSEEINILTFLNLKEEIKRIIWK